MSAKQFKIRTHQYVVELVENRLLLSGTWTDLSATMPAGEGPQMGILLSNGSVMFHNAGISDQWLELSPDNTGGYENGTWSHLTPMDAKRLYFASNVLPDGRVFVLGGEYSSPGGELTTGEIYDPVKDSWTDIQDVPFPSFGDDPTAVLPDGTVLAGKYSTSSYPYGTAIYNPSTNSWAPGGTSIHNNSADEEGWTKLSDGSILQYDILPVASPYANASDNPSLDPTTGITLSASIYAKDWAGNPRILQKGSTDDQYRLLAEDGLLKFDLDGVGSVTAALPSTKTWHMVTGTWDGSTLQLYVDGALAATKAATGTIATTSDDLIIGAKSFADDLVGNHFDGELDNVLIYGRALSGQEIQDLVADNIPTNDLRAEYTFEEGGGATSADLSGNGNNLTLQGGASFVAADAGDDALQLNRPTMGGKAERYIPATNTWLDASAGALPILSSLYELGPSLLLPDGRAIFFGDNGRSAFYSLNQ